MRPKNQRRYSATDRLNREIERQRYAKRAKEQQGEIDVFLDREGYGGANATNLSLGDEARFHIGFYLERKNPIIQIEVFIHRKDRFYSLIEPNQINVNRPADEWQQLFLRRVDVMRKAVTEHLEKVKCPHCGDLMVRRKVKQESDLYGESFLGCIRFPDCRGMDAPWKQTAAGDDGKWIEDVHCPDCGHPIAVRYAKRGEYKGKRFYGCTDYPRCKRIVEKDEFVALKMLGKDGQKQPDVGFDGYI